MVKNFMLVFVGAAALIAGVVVNQKTTSDFMTTDANEYRWSDMQGEFIVINFFAEWCAPCLREIPEINDFYQETKGLSPKVNVFGVSFDPLSDTQLLEVISKYNIAFPIITSDTNSKMIVEMPKALPTTYIVGPTGEVLKRLEGEQTKDSLLSFYNAFNRS